MKIEVQEVAQGLNPPWAVELLLDGRYLVTERPGTMRGLLRVRSMQGRADCSTSRSTRPSPPTAPSTGVSPSRAMAATALARGVLNEAGGVPSLSNVSVIFRQMPTFALQLHFGSRIAFGRDGKLFLSLGERSLRASRVQAQDLGGHFGKVVRLNTDGSATTDNPLVGRSGAKQDVWSCGHRNVQAATIDSATGRLWTVEHGPRGGDELNLPEAGKNYGWPITYGIDYPGPPIGDGIQQQSGMEEPVYYWDPVIAPSGMMMDRGALFPHWHGSVFIGALGGAKLVRLQLDGDRVVGERWKLSERRARIRDVNQGRDGAIYVLTEEGANSKLLRLRPTST